jgi:hypothetical protein
VNSISSNALFSFFFFHRDQTTQTYTRAARRESFHNIDVPEAGIVYNLDQQRSGDFEPFSNV